MFVCASTWRRQKLRCVSSLFCLVGLPVVEFISWPHDPKCVEGSNSGCLRVLGRVAENWHSRCYCRHWRSAFVLVLVSRPQCTRHVGPAMLTFFCFLCCGQRILAVSVAQVTSRRSSCLFANKPPVIAKLVKWMLPSPQARTAHAADSAH